MNGVEIVTSELGPLSPDLYFRLIPTPFKAVPIHRFLLVQDSLPALFWGLEPSERSFRASRPAKTELRLFDPWLPRQPRLGRAHIFHCGGEWADLLFSGELQHASSGTQP